MNDRRPSRSSASAASACRWRCPSPTAACACSASTTTRRVLASVRDGPDAVPRDRRPGAARARARSGRLELSERVADAARADAHRDHARHAVVLAHRDRHARDPRGARRPAAACSRPGHVADPALDDRARARPSSSPATSPSAAGFAIGEDVFVAHAPERIAAGRFLEEIDTLPCIIGGVGEALERGRRPSCSRSFGAPIVQTTPVQAELAKIWTNILRYTHVRAAEPADDGLRALRRERVRGDRPDQPRLPARRHRAAGADRRHLPAQGLRVLRGALERARACCSRSRASTSRCRCSWSRASSGGSARSPTARSRCSGLAFKADTDDERDSLSHKLIRLLERELADVAVHDPHVPHARRSRSRRRSRTPTS